MLLQYKPELNIFETNGFTALVLAISENHPECARLLLENGADLDLKDKRKGKGKTPKELCKEFNRPKIKGMIEKGNLPQALLNENPNRC